MNYNARSQQPHGGTRKLSKRPNETPGLTNSFTYGDQTYQQGTSYNPYEIPPVTGVPNITNPQQPTQYNQNAGFYQGQQNVDFNQGLPNTNYYPGPPNVNYNQAPSNLNFNQPQGFQMADQFLSNPMVANVAMQYGSAIVGSGRKIVDQEIEKYVPVSKIKYYFAVDTNYVLKKLRLLFFPFTHKDWSVKFDRNEPVQPRFEVNAPDLYIPTMAYVTYVLVAGLVLGTQGRFSPEVLGILASSALAWTMVEIVIEWVTLYVINISTHLKTLDLLAFSGYKYVGIIFAVLLSLLFNKSGYYAGLIYSSAALAFFLIRALKWQVLEEVTAPTDTYTMPMASSSTGNKRRLYFLLFVAGIQPFLMWWLSAHLVPQPLPPLPNL
uniref:Protein YIF1 n=2 Tax=Clastoptera arizonana TaxID=38151 RepID=A0A1B6E7H8_9HEMI